MRNWCALHCALHRMTACEADKVQIAIHHIHTA